MEVVFSVTPKGRLAVTVSLGYGGPRKSYALTLDGRPVKDYPEGARFWTEKQARKAFEQVQEELCQ